MQHIRQSRHLVAQLCGLFKLQLLRVGHHARLEAAHHVLRLAAQKALGIGHVLRIVGWLNVPHAGAGAALDLVQQAGPCAVGEYRVLAGAQAEHLLHQQNRFLHRPRARVRAEVAVLFFHRTAVVRNPRKLSWLRGAGGHRGICRRQVPGHRRRSGHLQVGVALVVPEQNVVLRVQRLDEVVFQQERLGLGAHYGGLHTGNLADHVADTGAAMVLLEVAADPLFQADGFAHIQHLPLGIEIPVDAGQGGQRSDLAQ